MRCFFAASLLTLLICSVAWAQTSTNPPAPDNSKGNNSSQQSGDSTSQQSQPVAPAATPDQGATPAAQKKSVAKRKAGELAPDCFSVLGWHKCRSEKSKPEAAPTDDSEYADDMDVGDFYLKERKNYAGAAMRFRDALLHKPNDPLATFDLAQALEGLHQTDEAREQYQTYVKLDPKGQFTEQAKKALQRLQSKAALNKSK